MITIRTNALLGPELDLKKDVRIHINEDGIISEISSEKKPATYTLPPSSILIPGFVNGHIHVGDSFLKDVSYGSTLEEAVGPQGIKHTKLNSSSSMEKSASIRNSLEMLVNNGYTTFIDFREQGIGGINLLKKELLNFPIRGLILGRNFESDDIVEILKYSDGAGLGDIFSLTPEINEKLELEKKRNPEKIIGIHVSESKEAIEQSILNFGKKDLKLIVEESFFNFVVHATYADETDLSLLREKNLGVMCCPISNMYHGLIFPPIEGMLKNNLCVALGTDNVMCSNPNPFRLMSYTLLGARANNQQLSSKDVLKFTTVNPGLIVKKKIGQISVGFSADFIGINLNKPNLQFSKDLYSAITMRAEVSDIEFQMYKGRLVK